MKSRYNIRSLKSFLFSAGWLFSPFFEFEGVQVFYQMKKFESNGSLELRF